MKNNYFGPPQKPASERDEAAVIFDYVANHLLKQKVMSREEDECRYRVSNRDPSERDLACAVGCLVTDEAYNKHWFRVEGCRLGDDLFCSEEGEEQQTPMQDFLLPAWMKKHSDMISHLQIAHDIANTEAQLLSMLQMVASIHRSKLRRRSRTRAQFIEERLKELDNSDAR